MITTPIAFLWPKDSEGLNLLVANLPTGRKVLWQRRLTWRDTDHRFGAFLDFLDTHGAQSPLSLESWHASFSDFIKYLPNQHFLFMIWMDTLQRGGDSTAEMLTWLPETVSVTFCLWREKSQTDERLIKSLREAGGISTLAQALVYRGISLASALQYNAMPSLVLDALPTHSNHD